jgi:putrescine transport system permease protein
MTGGSRVRKRRPLGERLVILIPLLWLAGFFLVPALIVLKISFSHTVVAQPPYVPVFDLAAGWAGIKAFLAALTAENYQLLWGDNLYFAAYLRSVRFAAIATAILLAIGYPIAYAMARAPRSARNILLLLMILPFWTAFLIRIYAWINILQRDGLLNQVLVGLGIVDAPISWLASDTALFIGLVYSYLPFMVLPLYASLERMDLTLNEAAADLGCPPWKAFWLITVPLSRPGIAAGVLLCFIPMVGEFVIPDLLGSSASLMVGQALWIEFFANRDWPLAAAVAVVMLTLLIVPIAVYQHMQTRTLERGQ